MPSRCRPIESPYMIVLRSRIFFSVAARLPLRFSFGFTSLKIFFCCASITISMIECSSAIGFSSNWRRKM